MKTGNSPSYLIRNPYSYCFRIKIPKNLQATVSKKELRYSLGTGNLSAAKNKARYLAGQFQLLFRDIKGGCLDHMKLTKEQIDKLIKGHKERLFEHYDKPVLYDEKNPISRETEFQWTDGYREWLLDRLASGNYSNQAWDGDTSIEQKVDTVLTKQGVNEIKKTSPEYLTLCQGFIKAEIKGLDHFQRKLNGDLTDDFEQVFKDHPDPQPKLQPVPEEETITLGELADKFEREKMKVWSPSASNKWAGFRKVFFRFHDPETQVHTFTRKTFYEYRELIQCLPTAFMTTKKYDGMMADDVKALKCPKPIHPKTVNNHIIFLHGMFKIAINLEYITKNPASDMQIEIKGDARKLRDMFTLTDLETIFNSPVLINARHPYQFWVTVLSMFTGARREELCNLYQEDIKKEDGVWYIDITANKPDKRIKTYQIRTVPIHPFLIELGFLEFVETIQKGQRLWSQLNNNNRDQKYGHYYGRWFNNKLLKPLNIKPTKEEKAEGAALKDHHSFRHTIINLGIRAGMDVQKVKGLVGHKEKGVTFGTYFKGFTVKQVYDEIVSKIDFGLDLSHLKDSKYVIK